MTYNLTNKCHFLLGPLTSPEKLIKPLTSNCPDGGPKFSFNLEGQGPPWITA